MKIKGEIKSNNKKNINLKFIYMFIIYKVFECTNYLL